MCPPEVSPSVAESLESVRAGLAGLAACAADDDDAANLGADCVELLRLVGGLQVQAARRLARFAALGGPAAEGAHSPAGWLGTHARLRPWEARRLAIIAARLHLLEPTLTDFEAGTIGFGDLATIAEGIDSAAETMSDGWTPERIAEKAQPILLEAATRVTPGRLQKEAARIALILDGECADRRRRQIDRQAFVEVGQRMDGVGALRAEMGAADLAIVEKAVDAFAPKPDAAAPRWANRPARRRLEGLVTACRIALRSAGREGYRERGGAPVRIHLIAPATTLDPAVPVVEAPPARTEFGTLLTAGETREMATGDDATTTTVHINPDGTVADRYTARGQPLNWGRTRRLFSAAQREIFLAIHATCAAEGCDRPVAWSAIDHKVEWAAGGGTDLANGQPFCDWHNLYKERRRSGETPGTDEGHEDRGSSGSDPPPEADT